jgi:quercetin dioxygenase-like cupin family protein
MDILKFNDMTRGWFIGDFEPSALKTKEFEVGVLDFKKVEKKPPHFHKISTEYNLLLSGSFTTNDTTFTEGDIFIIYPNEIVNPDFHTDCRILCVKTPSAPKDKYEL